MSDRRLFDLEIGPTKEGREVYEVSVFYAKDYRQRGYYARVTGCTVDGIWRTYRIMFGTNGDPTWQQLLEGCNRLNRKRLQFFRDVIAKHTDRAALLERMKAGDHAGAWMEILRAVERGKAQQEAA